MRVQIEVPVVVAGRMKTSHSHKSVFASVPQVFDIPEYSLSEVPVVLAVEERFESGNARRVEYFGVDGLLYTDRMFGAEDEVAKALHLQRCGENGTHPFFSAVEKLVEERMHSIRKQSLALAHQNVIPAAIHEYYENFSRVPYRFKTLKELGVRHYDEAAVEKQLAAFAKRMERMVVVGGNVLAQEQEPVIRIGGYWDVSPEVSAGLHVRPEPEALVNVGGWGARLPYEFLPLADHDRMAERVHTIAKRFKTAKISTTEILEVEIGDPRYLTSSAEAGSLLAVADIVRRAFVEGMTVLTDDYDRAKTGTEKKLLSIDPAHLALAQRLTAGIAASGENEISQELETAMSGIVQASACGSAGKVFGKPEVADQAAEALEAWQDRAVYVDMSPATALRV